MPHRLGSSLPLPSPSLLRPPLPPSSPPSLSPLLGPPSCPEAWGQRAARGPRARGQVLGFFLQVVQTVLGVLSGVLGGCLYFFYSCSLRESGAALWTGTAVSPGGGGQSSGRGERPSRSVTVTGHTVLRHVRP